MNGAFMSKSNKANPRKPIVRKIHRRSHRAVTAKSPPKAAPPQRGAKLGGSSGGAVGKLTSLIAMLRRPKGATIEQMMTATGWQAHSVRGAISGALKKKRGLTVTSAAESGSTRVYRIVG
jgi:hypothetical protein